jgi:hypothetical protein
MRQSPWNGAGLLALVIAASACGSSTPKAPTPVAPAPKASSAPAPSASAASSTQPAAEVFDVDMVPTRISPEQKPMPTVGLEGPGIDQFLPATFVNKDYKVKARIGNWDKLPAGSYLQLVLDNVPGAPVTDPKTAARILDLAPGGELAVGEHVIAGFMCRANHESVKGSGGVAVNRFWVAKVTTKDYKSNAPMLILNRPHGAYKGAAADDILVDFYVLNTLLGDKDNYVHIALKGPGIKEELTRNINEWRPYSIVSPHNGEYTITAELMDKNGNLIAGGWNSTSRKFTVEK